MAEKCRILFLHYYVKQPFTKMFKNYLNLYNKTTTFANAKTPINISNHKNRSNAVLPVFMTQTNPQNP